MVTKPRGGTSVEPVYQQPTLALPASFADAVQAWGGEMLELPTDWRLVEKESLIGVPFFVHTFRFNESSIGKDREFVSVQVVTEDDRRLVFNDGSTGVYAQAKEFVEQYHRVGGLVCKDGLRVSKYVHPEFGPAETFYLT
jgi:hypothetical protein